VQKKIRDQRGAMMHLLDGPFVPFSENEIREIESTLGRALPEEYAAFARKYGGAFVGGYIDGEEDLPILAFFSGSAKNGVLAKLASYSDLRDAGVLPIADCALGNLYVLDPVNGVWFIDYYGGKTTARKVANSFGEFSDRIVIIDE
jgi:hypothetical protein